MKNPFGPTYHLVRTSFWKAFYKLTLGTEIYKARLKNATRLGSYADQSTAGRLNHFYDSNGDQIRGFSRPSYRRPSKHPLLKRYSI